MDIIEESQTAVRHLEMNPGTKKLYFVETKKHSKAKLREGKETISLNTKLGLLSLSTSAVRTLGISNKWYKIYHDSANKVIGFKIKSILPNSEFKKGWRLAKIKNGGSLTMSAKPAVNSMLGLKDKYYGLEIKRYRDYQSKLDDSTYYYVELK